MKRILLTVILTIVSVNFFTDGYTRDDTKKKIRLKKPDIVDFIRVNYNNWSYMMSNDGTYMYFRTYYPNYNGNSAGGEFPRGSGNQIVYSCGLWIGTYKNGKAVVAYSPYQTEYQPGRIRNSGVSFDSLKAEDPLSPIQQVYLIDRSRNGDDYQNWPPDALRDFQGFPALVADAQTWAVFNDLDTSLISPYQPEDRLQGGLGLQVILESFVSNFPILKDVVYVKVTIENKTNVVYNNTFFGAFMDADVGGNSSNDYAGSDSTRGLGFVYNGTHETPYDYAAGVDILQGPAINISEIPSELATRFSANQNILKYDPPSNTYFKTPLESGKLWMGATAFTDRLKSSFDDNASEYNYLQGKHFDGTPRSGVGYDYKYAYPGDPLTQQGTPHVSSQMLDEHVLLSAGPFTLEPGKTQDIWLGIIGAVGTDRLDAVRNLFKTDDVVQQVFDKGPFFTSQYPAIPLTDVASLDGKVVITWKDNAETAEDLNGEFLQINKANGYTADYVKNDFQGYRVYRSLTGLEGSFELLTQFDKVDTIGSIINRTLNANGVLEISAVHLGDNTGLRYTYTDEGLTNGQNYFYSVTAYDAQPYIGGPDSMLFDGHYIAKPLGLAVSLESEITSNIFSAVPNAPIASVKFDAAVSSAAHTTGVSDGYIAVEIVDPEKVTGHTYRIEFSYMPETISGDTLAGVTPGQTIYKVFDVTASAYMKFSSRTDDPRTFLDRVNDGVFNGADSAIDERYYGNRVAQFDADLTDEDFLVGDGLLWKVYGSTAFFNSVRYIPGIQYSAAFVFSVWWKGFGAPPFGWGVFVDQEYESLGIGSPTNGMTVYNFQSFGGPVIGSGGDAFNKSVKIVFSRDSTNWQYIYSTTGGSGVNMRYLRVPFQIFEIDPTDGNATPRQLNARTRDRNTAGGNSRAWGLYTGGFSQAGDSLDDGLGPQTRGFLFVDTTTYDLGSKTGHYGSLDGTEKLYSAADYFSSPSYMVWTPAPRDLGFDQYWHPELTDGNDWNLLCRSVIGNATEFNQGQQGYVYRQIPDEGTIQAIVNHPYTNLDAYTVTTTANSQLSKAEQKKNMKDIKVVPNPFYKYSSFETSYDKLIKFTNLPSSCTIRIFTVAGDLVKTIKHNSTSDNDRVNSNPYDEDYTPAENATSIERWDLKTANGHFVASGMYIALVESPAGKRLVKFAVIQ